MSTPNEPARTAAEHAIEFGVQLANHMVAEFNKSLRRAFESPETTEARRRIACAQRTEQQIRAIVRDEMARTFVAPPGVLHPYTVVTDNVPPGGAR